MCQTSPSEQLYNSNNWSVHCFHRMFSSFHGNLLYCHVLHKLGGVNLDHPPSGFVFKGKQSCELSGGEHPSRLKTPPFGVLSIRSLYERLSLILRSKNDSEVAQITNWFVVSDPSFFFYHCTTSQVYTGPTRSSDQV